MKQDIKNWQWALGLQSHSLRQESNPVMNKLMAGFMGFIQENPDILERGRKVFGARLIHFFGFGLFI